MKKKLISFLLALTLLTTAAGAVDLYVDMNKIATDTPPMVVDGRTLVPVRAIFEAIGATVTWDDSTRTATGIRGDVVVSIQIDNTTAYVNGQPRILDVPAQIINGRTMVPARFISESMGCDVTWDQPTQTVGVANELKGVHIYVTRTGSKYHYSNTCNGGTYYEATLAEATGRGLTACDKCVLTQGTPTVPTTPATPSVPAAPAISAGQKSALDLANRYLQVTAFSYEGLIKQLEYENCSHEDAVYAATACGADWNIQALKKAQSYLDVMPFSYNGLINQLIYDQFTPDQAAYAADNCGADWNFQAAQKAASYVALMSFTRDGLISQLEYDGFTHEQAVYGAEQNGY